jgi:hypothetical protein
MYFRRSDGHQWNLSKSPSAKSNEEINSINVEDGILVILAFENNYALLYHPLYLGEEYKALSVEIKIRRAQGHMGYSWGPGIYFYWSPSQWISLCKVDDYAK